MTTASLTLCTTVGEAERPLVIAAARQLSDAVSSALGHRWPVSLILAETDGGEASGAIWIASLIEDVSRTEPIEATTRRWLDRIERWSQRGAPRILLSTLFHHIAPGDPASIERLRRLNAMALHLSRTTGVEIVDIDRLFAWCGARALVTDYRCLGTRAAELGGHAIAAAIFAGGLDDVLPPEVQDKAARIHGGVQDMGAIFQRRIGAS